MLSSEKQIYKLPNAVSMDSSSGSNEASVSSTTSSAAALTEGAASAKTAIRRRDFISVSFSSPKLNQIFPVEDVKCRFGEAAKQ